MDKKPFVQRLVNRYIWDTNQEKRSETVNLENPNVPLNGFTLSEVLGGGRTSKSGVVVSPENSLRLSAVWRCVSILSGVISSFRCCPYFENSDGSRTRATDHPTYKLFSKRPNPLYTKTVYWERAVTHLLLRGNHYSEIIFNKRGEIIRFDLLQPNQVKEIRYLNGKLWYFIAGRDTPVPGERMAHVPHLGEDPICGKSTIQYAREDLGMEMSRRNWGANFWFDGGMANGLLVPQQKLSPQQESQAKTSYREAKREGGDILMPFGFDYKKMSVDPADAEFIMSGNYSIAAICRWFGVPLHKLSELSRATLNNIEHQAIEFLQDTISPIVEKIENEYETKCYTLPGEEEMELEFDMNSYQRADITARSEANRTAIQNGYKSPNEAALENGLPPTEGGDRRFIQQNMMPLDSVDKILIQKQSKPPAQQPSARLQQCVRELAELAELEYKTNGNGNGHH